MAHTIRHLAQQYAQAFTLKTKQDGSEVYVRKEPADDELQDLIQDAHDDMLPDDFRYQFIVEALQALADNEDPDDAQLSIEPDIYHHELTAWLDSNIGRTDYLTQVQQDCGPIQDGFELLSTAQLFEKYEVFHSVLASLNRIAEDDED
jgi:hypothetical protein